MIRYFNKQKQTVHCLYFQFDTKSRYMINIIVAFLLIWQSIFCLRVSVYYGDPLPYSNPLQAPSSQQEPQFLQDLQLPQSFK